MLLQKPIFVDNKFFLFSKETEKSCVPHFHHYAEIIFSGDNTLDVYTGTQPLRQLQPHEMLIIPPELVHTIVNPFPGKEYQLLQINLDKLFLFLSPCPYADYVNLLFSESISHVTYQDSVVDEVTSIFNIIKNKFEIKYIGDLIQIINIIHKNTPEDIADSDSKIRDLKFYSTLNEIMESEPMDNLHLDYISKRLFMSKSTFQRQVKKCIGLSFHTWLQKYKMKRAVIDLRKKIPISEIAFNLGFSSASHFCKTFKTYYGVTPKESRDTEQPLEFIK